MPNSEEVLAALAVAEPDYGQVAQWSSEMLPVLARLVEGQDPALAAKAVYGVGLIAGDGGMRLLQHAANRPEVVVRIAAAGATAVSEANTTSIVLQLLADPDQDVRIATLKTLTKSAPSRVLREVEAVSARDESSVVSQIASETLERIGRNRRDIFYAVSDAREPED